MTTYTDMHAAQQLDALFPGMRAELDRLRGEAHALRVALAAERARAEAAEAKLAAADEYGQYTEFQGRLNAPVYNFEVWWRWRTERLAQGEVKS